MKMNEERVQELTAYLSADPDRMLHLFDLSPEAAAAQINADGHDFTAEELKEFAQAMSTVSQKGELDAEDLDNVSGGILTVATVSCVCSIVSLCGPYAWKAGQWLGTKIGNAIYK